MRNFEICAHCQGLAEDPVTVTEMPSSGPDIVIYAHAEHADLVERVDPRPVALLARIRAMRGQAKQ